MLVSDLCCKSAWRIIVRTCLFRTFILRKCPGVKSFKMMANLVQFKILGSTSLNYTVASFIVWSYWKFLNRFTSLIWQVNSPVVSTGCNFLYFWHVIDKKNVGGFFFLWFFSDTNLKLNHLKTLPLPPFDSILKNKISNENAKKKLMSKHVRFEGEVLFFVILCVSWK